MFSSIAFPFTLSALFQLSAHALIPVKYASTDNLAIRTANEVQQSLQPRGSLNSLYIDEAYGSDFVISVTHVHDALRYVSLDDLEGLGINLDCKLLKRSEHGDSSSLILSFLQPEDLAVAEQYWTDGTDLIFSTTHPGCDSTGQTSLYWTRRIQYIPTKNAAIVEARVSPLSDHNVEGHTITVDGAPTFGSGYRLARRQSSPDPLSYDGTISLNTPFSQPNAPLFTSPQFNVTCIDCSLSGQVHPAFSVTINNDTAAINSTSVDGTSSSAHGLIHDFSLNTTVTQPIAANMTLQVSSVEGVNVHCSIPGVCNVTALYPGRSDSSFGQAVSSLSSFKLAGLDFAPNISWGLRLDLQVTAETTLTIPFNTFVPDNQSASIGLHAPEQNTINPTFHLLPPSLSIGSVNACATVAYGPQASLALTDNGATLLSVGGVVDMPKVEVCLSEANGVDNQCDANGAMAEAIQADATVKAGATFNADAFSYIKENTGDEFEPTLFFLQQCYPLQAPSSVGGSAFSSSNSSTTSPTSTSNGTGGTPYTPTRAPPAISTGAATSATPSAFAALVALFALGVATVPV